MLRFIIYSRKSSEDEDRQVQSIESQEAELKPLATRLNFTVVRCFGESRSAKEPGRPKFMEMMRMIERREADGILCWKLDRLARNPIDGAAVIWAMKRKGLIVRTPQQSFSQAEDNQILMYIEFGMAQKYIDDLGRNTQRGLNSKAEKGWCPGFARLGYLNSKVEERGLKTILPDPERFHLVRRMWDLFLSGNYTPAHILKIANHDWCLRTRRTKRTGGKPICRSTIYKMFADPFYCGRYEYPKGSGKWFRGRHKAMVSEAEFESVRQKLVAQVGGLPLNTPNLPLLGLFRCGYCKSAITGHSKVQVRCTSCNFKSSVKNTQACAKCGLKLEMMERPSIRSYAYYHCTRTLNAQCKQPGIRSENLEKQACEAVRRFFLNPKLITWLSQFVDELEQREFGSQQQTMVQKRKQLLDCETQLKNLVALKTSAENFNGSLLTDDEYRCQRQQLSIQREKLEKTLGGFEEVIRSKSEVAKSLLAFFEGPKPAETNNLNRVREVLRAIGSNHELFGAKLIVKPEFPFSDWPFSQPMRTLNFGPIEPDETVVAPCLNAELTHPRPSFERTSDKNRTSAWKILFEKFWKQLDPWSPRFEPYRPGGGSLPVPARRRNARGRFTGN